MLPYNTTRIWSGHRRKARGLAHALPHRTLEHFGSNRVPGRLRVHFILSVLERRLLWGLPAVFVLCGIWLNRFPNVDLTLAALFYDPVAGFIGKQPAIEALRDAGKAASVLGGIGCVAGLCHRLYRRRAAVCLAVLLLGPVLTVNVVFKEVWGRARPSHTQPFGGSKMFTPAWQFSTACAKNCSFISGEAAGGFWFLSPALAVRERPQRRRAVRAALAWGTLMSAVRMAAGGHFFSDVLLAALLTVWLALFVPHAAQMLAPGGRRR